ncbi:hypothetical protein FC093_14265 [Ilyomonas limi]|uniref:Blue (type 1) copper domain-containing protein n=1 Tax=Ilyomonas limi TaxID=2575867 RepID=A0A4U3L1T4_9BACT|nr:plastocyanin/azurin family copper-binding protein [Ilyomonas limi]TKK67456.1 hypothetical protein FC093_14265 [Ilyomonas limi]
MKKITLLFTLAFIAISSASFAKRIIIKVSNFQFSPSSVNAKVGDTIIWKWVTGKHTTTSLSIPANAKAWDRPIDVDHKSFRYILKVAGVYKYDCTIHASVMKGTLNVTKRLTANLDNFTINGDNAQAMLKWNTTSSEEVSYFSIQRSTDGNNFTEIAKVNANTSNLYNFKDRDALQDKYIYYQVAMVDVNGNRQLSPIQMFANTRAITPKLITSLSPNPISSPGHLMLQFNADKDGTMLAKLYNQTGLLIKEEKLSAVKGLNNGHFHMGSLAPGTYYIVFTLGDITEKHVVVVQ